MCSLALLPRVCYLACTLMLHLLNTTGIGIFCMPKFKVAVVLLKLKVKACGHPQKNSSCYVKIGHI